MKKLLFILLLCSWQSVFCQYYTGSNTPFGQSRVQYNSFFWHYYDFQRFKTHFTKGGNKHAVYTAKTAHIYLKELEKFLDFKIEDKIHFIIYNSQNNFRQSNIGLTNDISSNIGGTAKIMGEKIFLYFNGDHKDFNRQIKAGIAEIIIHKILYGSDLKQSVKSSSFTNLPIWFKNGLIDYLSNDWDTEIDGKLKNLILSEKIKKFYTLSNEESQLYGHGIWQYIDEVFGRNMIPNLIYMMKVSKSVESGFIYVLGTTLDMVQDDFIKHYKTIYNDDIINCIDPNGEPISIKSKKQRIYRQFKTNKKGDKIAFVEHYLGQYKVKIYDLSKKRLKTVLKGDHKLNRIPDFTHPVIAWHPQNKILAIFEEKKGEVLLNLYDTKEKKGNPRPLNNIEKVLSCSYNQKGDKIILSGVNNSQTDIYEYSVLGSSQKQITNDQYDNYNPKYFPNSNEVIFSSNRSSKNKFDTPNTNTFDLFKINVRNRKLTQLTNTPDINEKYPQPISLKNYHYLSDKNGIYNHYQKSKDSAISYIDTIIHYRYFDVEQQLSNFSRNALEICFSANHNHYSILYKLNDQYQFYLEKKENIIILEKNHTNTFFIKSKDNALSANDNNLGKSNINEVNIYNYQFESEKEKKKSNEEINSSKKSTKPKSNFVLPLKKIYNVNFTIGEFVMQLNPTFNNLAYQRFSNSGFKNAGFDGFTMIQAKDVFEDYKLTGGFKGPVQLNNTGFIVVYENLKNRMDKKTQLSRQSFENFLSDNNNIDQPIIEKTITNDIKHQYSYPFSEVSSLRLTSNIRIDKIITLSNNPNNLPTPNKNHILGGGLLEYVYDATRPVALNINNGFKFKTWFEGYREIDKVNTDFFVVGFDVRNYQKIHKNIVFASRIAASTSFGSQKLIYYLGGVDGYLFAKYDGSIAPDPSQNYQFQTIATPLRGFYQNARNGKSFIGISNEIRVPLFSYFSNRPLKSDFLENFMIIGFNDIGAAWTGKNPYSAENAFNNSIVNGTNWTINIESQKEPIVYSYGFGIRSRLFGYYVRLDWGYGIDDHIAMPSIKQLSLSLDF